VTVKKFLKTPLDLRPKSRTEALAVLTHPYPGPINQDMAHVQTWDEAFRIPPEMLKNWQSQLNQGQSLLQFCLLHGHLPEARYFPWAMGTFQLPKVRKDFFSVPPDLVFWELVRERFAWSAELVPLAEWEGIMMVGCLTLPNVRIPYPHQFVLASAHDLLQLWTGYVPAKPLHEVATTQLNSFKNHEARSEIHTEDHSGGGSTAQTEAPSGAHIHAHSDSELYSDDASLEVTKTPKIPGENTRAEFEALADAHDAASDPYIEPEHSYEPAEVDVDEPSLRPVPFVEVHNSSFESELNTLDVGTNSSISISLEAPEGLSAALATPEADNSFSMDEHTQLDNEVPSDEHSGEYSDEHSGQETDAHSGEHSGEEAGEHSGEHSENAGEGVEAENKELLEGLNFDTSKASTLDFSSLMGGISKAQVSEPAAAVVESHAVRAEPEIPQHVVLAPQKAPAPPTELAEPVLSKVVVSRDLPPSPADEFKLKPVAPPLKPRTLLDEAKQIKISPPPVSGPGSGSDPGSESSPESMAADAKVTKKVASTDTETAIDQSMLSFVSQISEANSSPLSQLNQKDLSACQSYDDLAMQTLLRVQGIFENGMILMLQGGQLRPWKWTDMLLSVHGNTVKPIPIQDASIFRIVLRTSLPYHGYIVANPVNSGFFNDFNRGKVPAHATLVPILIERQISGIIMGLSDNEVDYKTSLSRMESLAKDVSNELKRLRAVKAA